MYCATNARVQSLLWKKIYLSKYAFIFQKSSAGCTGSCDKRDRGILTAMPHMMSQVILHYHSFTAHSQILGSVIVTEEPGLKQTSKIV